MNKLKLFLLVIIFISICSVYEAAAQDCNYWNATVGVKGSNLRRGDKDEKDPANIMEGIECLLKLEGDKSRGAFGGTTSLSTAAPMPSSTVEICALYYISVLFYGKYNHASAVVLRYRNFEENQSFNSDEAVEIAYKSYRKWFEKVKEIGLENARKQKFDPLECSGVRWY